MILGMVRRLSDVGVWLAGLSTLLMMVHITADVALKYLFNWPVPGTLEIVSTYYMVAAVFLPIAVVELYRASIAVDTVYQFLPRPVQFLCMIIVFVTSATVYLTLAWTSWGDALRSFAIGEVIMGNIAVSVWPSRFLMPISLFVAGVVCLWYLYRLLMTKEGRDELIALKEPTVEEAEEVK